MKGGVVWKKKAENDAKTFCRYEVTFDGGKKLEVVVRRGAETGSHVYGFEQSSRMVKVGERGEFELKLFEGMIRPPPMRPGQTATGMSADFYRPHYEVLFIDGVEVLFTTTFGGHVGFAEEEIMAAIETIPQKL